ncbi:MAG: dienelactone hydrolase family protein [Sphingomonas sp.]|nr:dienelactone hydrolase family protein [Sphingomonas sp.]
MTTDQRHQAITLYDRFTHGLMERRAFMARMIALAGSVAAAESLIAAISASPAAASIVPADDKRLATRTVTLGGYKAYVAEPRSKSLKPTILVIHENRGLNEHIRDIARRLALAGFRAVAPDMLSPTGGTPANEDTAREAIGKLDLAKANAAGVAMVRALAKSSRHGKVGAIGFCWGGAFVDQLAVAAGKSLAAGVSYYGPAPSPSEAVKVEAPLLLHYAGLDTRVAETAGPWVAALKAAHKKAEAFTYPGVDHAFNNDTSAERYNKAAADLAWKRTLAFVRRYLA